jgi:hypothetical protein
MYTNLLYPCSEHWICEVVVIIESLRKRSITAKVADELMTNDGEPVIQTSSEDHVTETDRIFVGTRHNGNLFCYLLGLSSLVIMTQLSVVHPVRPASNFHSSSSRSSNVQAFQKRARLDFTFLIAMGLLLRIRRL